MPLASSLLRDRRGECIGNIRGRDKVSIDRPINKTNIEKPFTHRYIITLCASETNYAKLA